LAGLKEKIKCKCIYPLGPKEQNQVRVLYYSAKEYTTFLSKVQKKMEFLDLNICK